MQWNTEPNELMLSVVSCDRCKNVEAGMFRVPHAISNATVSQLFDVCKLIHAPE